MGHAWCSKLEPIPEDQEFVPTLAIQGKFVIKICHQAIQSKKRKASTLDNVEDEMYQSKKREDPILGKFEEKYLSKKRKGSILSKFDERYRFAKLNKLSKRRPVKITVPR